MTLPTYKEFSDATASLGMELFMADVLRDAYRFNATNYYSAYACCANDPTVAAFWYKRMQDIHRAMWQLKTRWQSAAQIKQQVYELLESSRLDALRSFDTSDDYNSPYQRILRLFPEADSHAHERKEPKAHCQQA